MMLVFLVFLTAAIVCAMWGLARPEGIISLPFLAAIFNLGFFAPQFFLLLDSPAMPPGGLEKMTIMATLCLVCTSIGYARGSKSRASRHFYRLFADTRLSTAALFLAALGGVAMLALARLPSHLRDMRSPEGVVVIVAFFAESLGIAFAFSLVSRIRERSPHATWLLVLTSLFMLWRIILGAKRIVVLELVLAVFGARWFTKHRAAPKWLGLAFLPAFALIITLTPAYRRVMHEGAGQWAAHSFSVAKLQAAAASAISVQSIENELRGIGFLETRNGVMNISAKSVTQDFDFGTTDIISCARFFLPRFIFGDLRDRLFPITASMVPDALKLYGYQSPRGIPPTGPARAYEAFWYAGCLIYFFSGYLVGLVYRIACHGNILAQGFWPHLTVLAVLMISHDTNRIIVIFSSFTVLVVPSLFFSRVVTPVASAASIAS